VANLCAEGIAVATPRGEIEALNLLILTNSFYLRLNILFALFD
jgi:hypothetical protein